MGGRDWHSHLSALKVQVSKILVGSCRTRIFPAGQLCLHDGSLPPVEQRLVAVTHTGLVAFLQPPLQGASPPQYLLKQLRPSRHAPLASHLSNVQPRPLAKTPISLHTWPCVPHEPSCVQAVYL